MVCEVADLMYNIGVSIGQSPNRLIPCISRDRHIPNLDVSLIVHRNKDSQINASKKEFKEFPKISR